MMNLNSNDLRILVQQVASEILPDNIQLRPLQLNAVIAALESDNSIISMATGAGKTFVYLVASETLTRLREKRTVTIILSPLIALLKQQAGNHPDKEAMVVGENSIADDVYALVKSEIDLKYLYMCPETYTSKFCEVVKKLTKDDDLLGMIIIDEGHLIGTCDENFRPSYPQIAKYIPSCVKLLMLSGTFTMDVLQNIKDNFQSYRPLTITNCTTVHGVIDRPELVYLTLKMKSNRLSVFRHCLEYFMVI
jgi:superfamily II DNA helicase RecQ